MATGVAQKFAAKPRTGDVQISENVDFDGLLLSDPVLKGLKAAGFERPSPIQLKAIPLGRCGLDLIVQAKSGTGKTCVFAVVALESLLLHSNSTQVVVLAPTREIAVQICDVITALGRGVSGLATHTFIGGLPVTEDKAKLKRCHIAVGTPGRMKQLIEDGCLRTESVRLFILDEADKLLEESFQEDVNWIYWALPENKQMLALSATYPESLARHLMSYMRNPTHVRMNALDPALLGIRQYVCSVAGHPVAHVTLERKVTALTALLNAVNFNQCLVFSNYQFRAESLCTSLRKQGWPCAYISGAQEQKDRLSAMGKLKRLECRVLVSTDVTSRGIDAEHVNLVVNVDVPYDHHTYLHRIGRAGRFGSFGAAVTLCATGKEAEELTEIEKQCSTKIKPLPDPVPSDLAHSSGYLTIDDIVTVERVNPTALLGQADPTTQSDAARPQDPDNSAEVLSGTTENSDVAVNNGLEPDVSESLVSEKESEKNGLKMPEVQLPVHTAGGAENNGNARDEPSETSVPDNAKEKHRNKEGKLGRQSLALGALLTNVVDYNKDKMLRPVAGDKICRNDEAPVTKREELEKQCEENGEGFNYGVSVPEVVSPWDSQPEAELVKNLRHEVTKWEDDSSAPPGGGYISLEEATKSLQDFLIACDSEEENKEQGENVCPETETKSVAAIEQNAEPDSEDVRELLSGQRLKHNRKAGDAGDAEPNACDGDGVSDVDTLREDEEALVDAAERLFEQIYIRYSPHVLRGGVAAVASQSQPLPDLACSAVPAFSAPPRTSAPDAHVQGQKTTTRLPPNVTPSDDADGVAGHHDNDVRTHQSNSSVQGNADLDLDRANASEERRVGAHPPKDPQQAGRRTREIVPLEKESENSRGGSGSSNAGKTSSRNTTKFVSSKGSERNQRNGSNRPDPRSIVNRENNQRRSDVGLAPQDAQMGCPGNEKPPAQMYPLNSWQPVVKDSDERSNKADKMNKWVELRKVEPPTKLQENQSQSEEESSSDEEEEEHSSSSEEEQSERDEESESEELDGSESEEEDEDSEGDSESESEEEQSNTRGSSANNLPNSLPTGPPNQYSAYQYYSSRGPGSTAYSTASWPSPFWTPPAGGADSYAAYFRSWSAAHAHAARYYEDMARYYTQSESVQNAYLAQKHYLETMKRH